ncbi:hypothetical protein EV143_10754 [Flavobacterium chryseum]|uniref:hypothetical protein n=1 Tax=Flavobacterium sp. P3160 TaxID=2512113 RepID=UPI00105BD35E|nr:hypothetical protein [Flavobacterium sp. P3160]TDO72749.1 hypothetical protein EV143_10754 [Flavobacterium sp. P3160]
MNFDTNSINCIFSFRDAELLFLVHNKQKLHVNDYAHVLYSNIIETLLMINEIKTIEFVERLDSEDDFEVVSNHFARLSGVFQSNVFINRIENAAKKYTSSKYYKWILDNIAEAKNALDNNESLTT